MDRRWINQSLCVPDRHVRGNGAVVDASLDVLGGEPGQLIEGFESGG